MTATLSRDGYEIRRGWFPINSTLQELVTERLKSASDPIFNENRTNRKNDKKRRQATIPLRAVRDLHAALATEFPEHNVGGVVAIQSEPGCQRQAAHCDYIPDEDFMATHDETVPLLFLLALEDGTTLDVWPGSHHLVRNSRAVRRSPRIMRATLALNAGDVVVFRGDLIHAGSGYETKNARIHAYLDHPSVKRQSNRTWIIYKHADPLLQAKIGDA